MEIKLSKRLKTISAFIENNSQIIDIGCDHGLLGIYLYQTKSGIRIVSSDINKSPLNRAYDNLVKYNLESKIELRLGNGIDCLDNDIDTIIISGMGGITITKILKDIKKYPNIKKIVISPNNDFVLTRKIIRKLGFKLAREIMVNENNKFYLVSEYIKGRSIINNYFGRLSLTDRDTINYYKYVYEQNNLILSNIPRKYIFKRIRLLKEQKIIKKSVLHY